MEEYYVDFPTEPIGGDNPYYKCSGCGISTPDINGRLNGHLYSCPWRQKMETDILKRHN